MGKRGLDANAWECLDGGRRAIWNPCHLPLLVAEKKRAGLRTGWGPAVRPYHLIHFVYSGQGVYYGPDGAHILRAGQGFIIFPGEVSLYVADAENPWHYGWVGYSGASAGQITRDAGLSLASPVFSIARAERTRRILAEICADVASMRAGEWSALGGLMRLLA